MACLSRGRDAGRVGVRRWSAVDHRTRREHPGPDGRAQVQLVSQRDARVGGAVQVADGRDAPGEVAGSRPPLHVGMRVDQSWNDGLAYQVDALGAPRHLNLIDAGDGLDVPIANEDDRVLLRRAPNAVDQRGALERDDSLALGRACPEDYRRAVEQVLHGFGSAEVWSWRMRQRSPWRCSTSVKGPLATIESPRTRRKRAVAYAKSGVRARTRTSSNANESRDFPGAK